VRRHLRARLAGLNERDGVMRRADLLPQAGDFPLEIADIRHAIQAFMMCQAALD
jgi:hypothetical protein